VSDKYHLRAKFTVEERRVMISVVTDAEYSKHISEMQEDFRVLLSLKNRIIDRLDRLDRNTAVRLQRVKTQDQFIKMCMFVQQEVERFTPKEALRIWGIRIRGVLESVDDESLTDFEDN